MPLQIVLQMNHFVTFIPVEEGVVQTSVKHEQELFDCYEEGEMAGAEVLVCVREVLVSGG